MQETELRALLEEARTNNQRHAITGLLFYVGQNFIQVIEGSPEPIGRLVANIRSDDRCGEVTVLLDHDVLQRSFQDWSMGYHAVELPDLAKDEGYLKVRNIDDFLDADKRDGLILPLMQRFYQRNARWTF